MANIFPLRGATRIAAAATIAAFTFTLTGHPAFALNPNTVVLSIGESAASSTGGISFVTPSDGRIRTPNYAAEVEGVAWPADNFAVDTSPPLPIITPSAPVTTAAGGRLVVFTLRLDSPVSSTAATPSLTVNYDGGQAPIDISKQLESVSALLATAPSSTATYAVAVPNRDHSVSLSFSEGEVSQSFSLWTLTRTGPSPDVEYRDASSPQVSAQMSVSQNFDVTEPSDGFVSPQTLSVTGATLSYLSPAGSPAAANDQAFLTLAMSATWIPQADGGWGSWIADMATLPASSLTLAIDGQTPITAGSVRIDSSQLSSQSDGLFDATYYFAVPASFSTGTLSIAPQTVTGSRHITNLAQTPENDQITSPISFPVTLPAAVTQPTLQAAVTWPALQKLPVATKVSGASAVGRHGLSVIDALLILVAAAVASGSYLLLRHRRTSAEERATNPGSITVQPGAIALPPAPRMDDLTTEPTRQRAVTDGGREQQVRVSVLGTISVTGLTARRRNRDVICEIVCYLAMHRDRPVTLEQITEALWPLDGDRAEPTRKRVLNYLSEARRALPPSALPDVTVTGGYHLGDSVACDWDEFQNLIVRSESDSLDSITLRRKAMSLVTATPFTVPPGRSDRYLWATTEQFATMVEVVVLETAHRLSTDELAAGNPIEAADAARKGLCARNCDTRLCVDLLRAARASGDPTRIRRAETDIAAWLGSNFDDIAFVHETVSQNERVGDSDTRA